ncbi:FAD-dependent oxidoreductase [Ensifer sp. T173]|uniref:FAD-dependent oxidoreductase n=1 Tax=Ensifer canadensis TaxID=555315 RepID=A0AAW4FH28_9HYPH|nr:NAD(P)/FAD-dependent oxidoreductase [Ensifer canadensis]MBM3090309.1 FAD-dependent oxidoreductase [Ensifer canadensis]UBI80306.1 FAD-dependent oxidoreductase [Ensifer canadensis]
MNAHTVTHAEQLAARYDLVVVGAGPGGLSAAIEASTAGARVLVVDENRCLGGQIYRAITRNTPERQPFLGEDYWKGRSIAAAFLDDMAVDYAPSTTVWDLVPADGARPCDNAVVGLSIGGTTRRIEARAVILATGAMERPMPVSGWTLPGVMTAGAAQIALKSIAGIPKGRTVLAGCGPLLYLLAAQLLDAGADITALVDTTDKRQRLPALRHLPDFLRSPYVAKGLALLIKVRRRTRIISNVSQLSINGTDKAQGVAFRAGGRHQTIAADCVLLHQGVIPNINLASAAGCEIEWNDRQRAFQPRTDRQGRTTTTGIFVAGDGAFIGGAQHAAVSGRIAALAALCDLGLTTPSSVGERAGRLEAERETYLRGRDFLDVLYRPAQQFRAPPDEGTIVCRCEEVTAGALRQAIALGPPGPNQLKTFTRCGMGPCQGRLCASTVTEMMAAERRVSPSGIGTYRLRAPVKPLRLSELAALPQTRDAVVAVTGRVPEEPSNLQTEKGNAP